MSLCLVLVSESGTENKVMVARAPEFRLELDSSLYSRAVLTIGLGVAEAPGPEQGGGP